MKRAWPVSAPQFLRGEEVLWSGSVGLRDAERGLPATPETLYCIGSVTKSFTALAIMQLWEQGKLDPQDPIDRHIPFHIEPFGEKIRIWHFLSHSSGLPGLGSSERLIGGLTGAVDHWLSMSSYNDLSAFMEGSQDWACTRPGERWFYLNEGFIALGQIIEKCSGMSYYEYIRKNILEPLGMQRTYFTREEGRARC